MQVTGVSYVRQNGQRLTISDGKYLAQQRRILRREIRNREKRMAQKVAN
jgi:hypothetical protein